MAFQQVEYEFPDPDKEDGVEIELEPTSAEPMKKPSKAKANNDDDVEIIEDDGVEVEVVDDTPKADRGRKPSDPLRRSLRKNFRTTRRRCGGASSTSPRATTTSVGPRKRLCGSARS
jgi:hypothetical protein